MTAPARLIIGCMSGTSCDAVDAALVRTNGVGETLAAEILAHADQPLGETGDALRRFSHGETFSAARLAALRRDLARAHIAAIERLPADLPPRLIACHGQTVFHAPPLSWQMLDPAPIAARFGVPVLHDLRAADLAVGGQGAPITPLADRVLFRDHLPLTVVNLGGFCNLTHIDASSAITGRDVCACNQLLDAAARRRLATPIDHDGAAASAGTPDPDHTAGIVRALEAQAAEGRSLGSADEGLDLLEPLDTLGAGDALATIASAIGRVIARAIVAVSPAGSVVALAGGGTRNAALVRAISDSAAPARVVLSDHLGVPAAAREAAAVAVLAALTEDGLPITLPAVTGVPSPAPVAGRWALPPDGSWEIRPRG